MAETTDCTTSTATSPSVRSRTVVEILARLADVLQDPLTVTADKLKAALMPDGEAPNLLAPT